MLIVLIIVGIVIWAIVGGIKSSRESAEYRRKENEKIEGIKKRYHDTRSYFSEGYSNRPAVNGDFFKATSYTQYKFDTRSDYTDSTTTVSYCQYANTANCVNCSRRYEHRKGDLYYYGVNYDCVEHSEYHYYS